VPQPEPTSSRKLYESVAQSLLGQISASSLRRGDQLPPERELTERFGVGRSSVREALRMLESQGVISSVTGGAFVVAEGSNPLNRSLELVFSLDEHARMHDLYELRRIVECEAAAMAARRRTQGQLDAMKLALSEMDASLSDPKGQRFINADLRFHLAVGEAADNKLLLSCLDAVRDVLRRALLTMFLMPGSPESAVEEHRRIYRAIEANDPGAARAEMHAHLIRVELDVAKGAPNG
jgi:GntR family transcriptional repressor for pyruvate dehydrogenase complex